MRWPGACMRVGLCGDGCDYFLAMWCCMVVARVCCVGVGVSYLCTYTLFTRSAQDKLLGGAPLDHAVSLMPAMSGSNGVGVEAAGTVSDAPPAKPVMLVYYIGGLTYMEISALRFLSKDPAFPYTIVMATTKLINGTSMITSMSHMMDDMMKTQDE